MNQFFINEAFDKAVNDYLKSADQPQGIVYNSFLVVVARILIIMYSELDILNSLAINDEELLKKNLMRFGYSASSLEIFFSNLQQYYDIEKENETKKS